MRFRTNILLLTLPFLFLLSCSNPNREAIKQISKLQDEVSLLEEQYAKVDVAHFQEILKDIESDIDYVRTHPDRFDLQDAEVNKYIGAYGSLMKSISRTFKRGGAGLESKIQSSAKQLANLKYDVRHNLIENSKIIEGFIQTEIRTIDRLKPLVEKTIKNFNEHQKTFEEVQPKAKEIILQAKQN